MSFTWLPASLVAFRLLIGPVLLFFSLDGATGPWVAIGMAAGIFSDIVDGMLARRLNVSNLRLRVMDSRVDLVFFLCLAASAWIGHRAALLPHLGILVAMLLVYAVSLIYPFIKFKRAPAYHAYSAKLAGLALFAAATRLFLAGEAGPYLDVTIGIAILSHLDRIAITFLLPEWQTDVVGFWKFLKIKRWIFPNKPFQ